MRIGFILFACLLMAIPFGFSMNSMLSDQLTSVTNSSGSTINGTVVTSIYNDAALSSLFFMENGRPITNGNANFMLGYNTSNPLSGLVFNKEYWKTYSINGQNVSFTDDLGNVVSSLPFFSPLGMIGDSSITNSSNYARIGTGTCPANYTANNVTATTSGITVQCIPAASATSGDLYINVTAGVITANLSEFDLRYYRIGNPFSFYNVTTLPVYPVYNNGTSNLTMTDVTNANGNWTADKTSYYTGAVADGRYRLNNSVLNYTNLTGFPSACGAGNAISALGLIPTCTAFLTSFTESDPLWTANQSSYDTRTIADGRYRLNSSALNWTNLTAFPTACVAGNYTSGVGTTLTCTVLPTYNNGTITAINASTGMNFTNATTGAVVIAMNYTGVTAGTMGNASVAVIPTYDATGRITGMSNATINPSTFTNMTTSQNTSNWVSGNTTCIIIKGATSTFQIC
jgi:hypothetical protein